MPTGIILFGANGSGKTTLGRELSRLLNFKCMDVEDYNFLKSEIPYAKPRGKAEVIELLLADIKKHGSFVLSAVTGDFGSEITSLYTYGVYLSAPLPMRMERIRKRAVMQYGQRVLMGGDMYESERKFEEFARTRNLLAIDEWAKTLTCPIELVDGTKDYRQTARELAKRFQ